MIKRRILSRKEEIAASSPTAAAQIWSTCLKLRLDKPRSAPLSVGTNCYDEKGAAAFMRKEGKKAEGGVT